jgi:hypothetical protein
MLKAGSFVAIGTLGTVFLCGFIGGCGIGHSGGDARLSSMGGTGELRLDLPTRVYTSTDPDLVDMYMTDLPESVWRGGADVSDMAGTIVHLRMFIRPRAGRTPIAETASTSTVRCMVLARGEIGVYGGGGFFVDGADAGEKEFRGSVRNATMRLVSATGGFNDRLGVSVFSGSVSARLDDQTAKQMERAVRALQNETRAVG